MATTDPPIVDPDWGGPDDEPSGARRGPDRSPSPEEIPERSVRLEKDPALTSPQLLTAAGAHLTIAEHNLLPVFPTAPIPGKVQLSLPVKFDKRRKVQTEVLQDHSETGAVYFVDVDVSQRTRGLKFKWKHFQPQQSPNWFILGLDEFHNANLLHLLG